MRHLFSRPEISRKIVLKNQVLVIGITKEITFCYWLVLMIEKLEGVLIRELHNRVLERAYLLKHLIRYLRIQTNSAMLELVKW